MMHISHQLLIIASLLVQQDFMAFISAAAAAQAILYCLFLNIKTVVPSLFLLKFCCGSLSLLGWATILINFFMLDILSISRYSGFKLGVFSFTASSDSITSKL